jgi:hypothetical protein
MASMTYSSNGKTNNKVPKIKMKLVIPIELRHASLDLTLNSNSELSPWSGKKTGYMNRRSFDNQLDNSLD